MRPLSRPALLLAPPFAAALAGAWLAPTACTPLEAVPVGEDGGSIADSAPPEDSAAPTDAGAPVDSGPAKDAGPADSGPARPVDFACGDKSAWTLTTRDVASCSTRRAQKIVSLSRNLEYLRVALGRSGTGRIGIAWAEETALDVATSELRTLSFNPGASATAGTTFPEARLYAAGQFDGPGYDGLAAVGGAGDEVFLAFAEAQSGTSNVIREAQITTAGDVTARADLATGIRLKSQVSIARRSNGDRAVSWYVRPTAAGTDGRIVARFNEGSGYGGPITATSNETSSADAPFGGYHQLAFDDQGSALLVWGTSGTSGSVARSAIHARGANTFSSITTILGSFASSAHAGLAPTFALDGARGGLSAFALAASGTNSGVASLASFRFDAVTPATLTPLDSTAPTYGTARYDTLAAEARAQLDRDGLMHLAIGYRTDGGLCRVEYRRQVPSAGAPSWLEDTVYVGSCAPGVVPHVAIVVERDTFRPHIAFTTQDAVYYATSYL